MTKEDPPVTHRYLSEEEMLSCRYYNPLELNGWERAKLKWHIIGIKKRIANEKGKCIKPV